LAEEFGIEQFGVIAFHLAAPYAIPQGYPRFSWYDFWGTPSVMFDGVEGKVGASEGIYYTYLSYIEDHLLDEAEIDLEFTGTMWDSTFDFNLVATVDEELPGDDPKVFFVIAEDSLQHSSRFHNFVARHMSDEYSVPLKNQGDRIQVNERITASATFDMSRLYFIAVVQNYGAPGKKVYNAAILDIPELYWERNRLTVPVDPDEERILPTTLHNGTVESNSYVLRPDSDLPSSWKILLRIDGDDYPDSAEVALAPGESKEVGIVVSADTKDEGEVVLDITYEDRRSNVRKVTFHCRSGTLDLAYDHHAVDDDSTGNSSGDGDGIIEPMEIIELSTFLENKGDIVAYDVTSELSSESPHLMFLGSTETFGDIPPSEVVEGSPARVFVQPDTPTMDIWIREDILDGEGNAWVDSFQIHVGAETGISISNVDISGRGDGVSLEWSFGSAGNWAGANVYRSTARTAGCVPENGPCFSWRRLNDRVLSVSQNGGMRFLDGSAPDDCDLYYRIGAIDREGNESFSSAYRFHYTSLPKSGLRVEQNVPNPFNPLTKLTYTVGEPSGAGTDRVRISVQIFDTGGKLVRTIRNELLSPGKYMDLWDGKDSRKQTVPSGIYYCRISGNGSCETIRMILLR
jgi:hypothetical protein